MWAENRLDAAVACILILRDKLLGHLQRRPANLLLRAQAEHAPREQRLHPRFFDDPRNLVHPKVVIGERDRAAANHFAGGERRAPIDILFRQRRFGHPNAFVEPAVEREVFGPTALERHGRVRVRVEKSRQRHMIASINRFIGDEILWHIANGEDAFAINHDIRIFEDAILLVQRNRVYVLNEYSSHSYLRE